MADRLAEGDRFAVDQIQPSGWTRMGTGSDQQSSDLGHQLVHPRQPLFVRGQLGERRPPILRHQAICLFEGGDFKYSLQQGKRQHFSITELGLGVRRATPLGPSRVSFEEFIHKTIEFDHLLFYIDTHRSSPSGKQNQRSRFDSTLPPRIDDLTLSTQD
jgi:hypothetical protein